MELYQEQLLNILHCSITGKKFKCNKDEIFEWEKVIKEAIKHDISALIYFSVEKNTLKEINKDILNEWKINVLKSNIIQKDILDNALKILLGLREQGIEVIVLKGFILKLYYSRPELRTMSDLDILIHTKDYLLVENYLTTIGYIGEEGNNSVHKKYYSGTGIKVEVHWKLINKNYFRGNEEEFERNIWKNSKEINVYGLNFRTLSDEDFLIHICMHMAVHSRYNGFGLRQLYDLALFIGNKYENIDSKNVYKRIEKYGMQLFVEGLYLLCNRLFEIKAPFLSFNNNSLTDNQIKLLLENILYSGVKGIEGGNLNYNFLFKDKNRENKILKFMEIVFSSSNELSPRYLYAKKFCWLLPIAWVHRIIRAIKKYGIKDMLKQAKWIIDLRVSKK